MDWTVFWTAFGAIGTTVGSLITAGAVVVAVKQYKEPLIKRIKIEFRSAIPINLGVDAELFCITVSNTGIRPINISNIILNVGQKDLVIHNAQFSIPGIILPLSFPVELQPEQRVEMYLDRKILAAYLAEKLSNGEFRKSTQVSVVVSDQTGGRHLHRTGCTVQNLSIL